jgi:hypothetical protein
VRRKRAREERRRNPNKPQRERERERERYTRRKGRQERRVERQREVSCKKVKPCGLTGAFTVVFSISVCDLSISSLDQRRDETERE